MRKALCRSRIVCYAEMDKRCYVCCRELCWMFQLGQIMKLLLSYFLLWSMINLC